MNISAPLWKCRRALAVGFDTCQRLKDGVTEAPASVFTAVNDLYYASVIFTVIIIITPACAIHFSSHPRDRERSPSTAEQNTHQWFNHRVFFSTVCVSRSYPITSVSTLVWNNSRWSDWHFWNRLKSSLERLLIICVTLWLRIKPTWIKIDFIYSLNSFLKFIIL